MVMEVVTEQNDTLSGGEGYGGLLTNGTTLANWTRRAPPSTPMYIMISATVLYSVIFLVGVLGNLLVVLVITCSRRMKTAVNVYLVNLCVADLLVIIICMPTALVDLFAKEVWYFGPVLCKLVPFIEYSVANASILTIFAISIERYKVIKNPLKSVEDHAVKLWRTNILIWIIAMTFCIPWIEIIVYRPAQLLDGTEVQVCRSPIDEDWKRFYILLMSSCFFILPAVGLLVINCHIYWLLRRSCHQFTTSGNKREYRRRQNQVANNVASIVLIFFLCHLPFRVSGLWFTFAPTDKIRNLGLEKLLLIIYSSRICFYLNHAINPLVYNFASSKFRETLPEIWTRTKLCRLVERESTRSGSAAKYTFRTATTANQAHSQR
ncbi:pyrokinin-1 receptor-like [Mya arenaria]|uniref:pyrokinin-1 receptor-like n=1 Tax=Mya arenaria TaxID=6604 RepID=UPI0022E89B7D|nr:pyrokinin-1 receptor-like [Mya arenaria]